MSASKIALKTRLEIFIHNVKWLRIENDLTKKEMAKIMGIGVPSLNKIENGDIPPRLSAEVLFNLYDVFMIHPKDLMERKLGE